jgi:methylmalonyl-CoA mutase
MIGLKDIFPANSQEEWSERLKKDLKADNLDLLDRYDPIEEIEYKCFGHSESSVQNTGSPGELPLTRGIRTSSNEWRNVSHIIVNNDKKSNEEALDALMKGADMICFTLAKETDLSELLKDIQLEYIHVAFIPSSVDQFKQIKKDIVNNNPLNTSLWLDLTSNEDGWESITKEDILNASVTQSNLFLVDGYMLRETGASAIQEILFALLTGHEYLIRLIKKGLTIDEASACIHFRNGIGSNYFIEIAKTRALKELWAKVVGSYHPEHYCSNTCSISAFTGNVNKSVKDPYTNLLRQTTEAMSAILGGIDNICVEPYDFNTSNQSVLAKRLGLNIPLILKEESYFNFVTDPMGGSHSLEDLTWKLAEKSWGLFSKLDKQGGIYSPNVAAQLREMVQNTRKKRLNQIKDGEKILIGINKFNNPQEETNHFHPSTKYFEMNSLILERDLTEI